MRKRVVSFHSYLSELSPYYAMEVLEKGRKSSSSSSMTVKQLFD
jgi:hypothetical protein